MSPPSFLKKCIPIHNILGCATSEQQRRAHLPGSCICRQCVQINFLSYLADADHSTEDPAIAELRARRGELEFAPAAVSNDPADAAYAHEAAATITRLKLGFKYLDDLNSFRADLKRKATDQTDEASASKLPKHNTSPKEEVEECPIPDSSDEEGMPPPKRRATISN